MDQLHMHFTQAIHNTVFQVVLGYVELCAGNADTKFQKMQYKDLCTVRPLSIHTVLKDVQYRKKYTSRSHYKPHSSLEREIIAGFHSHCALDRRKIG